MVKNPPANAGYAGSVPGLGRSPGEGNGNPLQYSCLENPMDRGTLRATVHGVTRVGHNLVTKQLPSNRAKAVGLGRGAELGPVIPSPTSCIVRYPMYLFVCTVFSLAAMCR